MNLQRQEKIIEERRWRELLSCHSFTQDGREGYYLKRRCRRVTLTTSNVNDLIRGSVNRSTGNTVNDLNLVEVGGKGGAETVWLRVDEMSKIHRDN